MRWITRVVRRFPWLAAWTQHIYRLGQGRFTSGAIGILLDEHERVLLVEHVFHSKHPWGLPGGWVERGETPARTAEREFLEETGIEVRVIYPIRVWPSPYWRSHIDVAFAVEVVEPLTENSIQLSGELINYQWAGLDELPSVLAEHRQVIELAVTYRRQRQLVAKHIPDTLSNES
jgi:8-oxo-dGTP pyrophosphatase MutT (NUDIX family)